MIRSEAVAEIKRGLGFRQTQDTTIIAALQSAQRILETGRSLPDWLLVYDAAITVTADDPLFALPERFLRFHEDYELYYTNSDAARVFIPRRGYQEAYTSYVATGEEDASAVDTETDTYPSVFVQRSSTAGLFIPTPTTSFTAYLTYYRGAVLLDTDVENLWLEKIPDLIISLAGMKVAGTLRDKDALNKFSTDYKMAQGSYLGDIVEQELAGRPMIMGRNN